MNNKQLEVIKIRANAATQGKWEWIEDQRDVNVMPVLISGDIKIMHFGDCDHFYPTEGVPPKSNDAEFIVHARQDVPDLIVEVERLRGALEGIANHNIFLVPQIQIVEFARRALKGESNE